MREIIDLVRPCIRTLKAYSSARDEYKEGSSGTVFLDANESPFGDLNRYPDPYQKELKKELARLKKVKEEQLFLGNGSDEVIDLLFRVFCEPAKDKILTFTPTYGMYQVSADINQVAVERVPLQEDFQIDIERVKEKLTEEIKIVWVCSPNNPTGNVIEEKAVFWLLENFDGLVVVDEAYVDFSSSESWSTKLEKYPKLVVLQTLSKAWGVASIRLGIGMASPTVLEFLNKVKPPYNVNGLTQKVALERLRDRGVVQEQISTILTERKRMENALQKSQKVKKVYPSDANFLLVEVEDADYLYEKLKNSNLIVRNRNKEVTNTLRITIGTAEQNDLLLKNLEN